MKIITAEQAAQMVQSDSVLAVSGFMLGGVADELLDALERRFIQTQQPRGLTVMAAGSVGDWADGGLNHLAHDGLIRRLIEGFLGAEPKLNAMVQDNRIEYYNFPIGVISAMFRALAQGKKGELTKLGLHTYLDPRLEGGACTSLCQEKLVELVELLGEEYLFYHAPKIDVALVRGTYADEKGNITFSRETAPLETSYVAMAAKACGGIVIAQVEDVVQFGSLSSREVEIFGNLVDYVVICSDKEKFHRQTVQYYYHPAVSGEVRVPESYAAPLPLDVRKVIARRGALELQEGNTVNVGIGIPEGVSSVAREEGLDILFTAESGTIGGMLLGGYSFGAGMNNWAVTDANTIFDFYMGGGLDITYLGMAQVNAAGDVNVARFGNVMKGSGGFVNISQPTRHVVFCGTFTAGGFQADISPEGTLSIRQEGKSPKFVSDEDLMQVTFSARYAVESGQQVEYITERAVFRLTPQGIMLTEIAPGVDLQRDILDQMGFRPLISPQLKEMDRRLFLPQIMGLKTALNSN